MNIIIILIILYSMDFIINNFENCIWLAVILVAICPTLESKIAIPLAMNTAFWGSNAYSPLTALLLSFVGSILPCFILMLIARKIKSKTAGFVTSKFMQKYQAKSAKIENGKSDFKKYLLLTCFVAVPIPLTGVWTGSIVAGLTNLDLKYSFISISIGTFISACAITLLCTLFTNSITYIFMISIFIIILFLFFELLFSILSQNKKKKTHLD